MGSKYPRSMRGCLPLWTLMLEVALILIFFFFTSYDSTSKDHRTVGNEQGLLQDVTVMAALGLGFLTSSLWRYSWSSVAFNFCMLALGVQWAVLVDGFLDQLSLEKVVIRLSSIQRATMSALSVLISAGAILGKANLVQLLVMALIEVTAFSATRTLDKEVLHSNDHLSLMYIHVFSAYFGLTVAWCLSRPLPKEVEERHQRAVSPGLFAMLGTLCLWMFWPSFNSILLTGDERKKAILNTYYALAASTVMAISMSALAHPRGKINMTHIHNAVLAGGVAMSIPGHQIPEPWIAMVLGLTAGLISIGGAKCLPVCFDHLLGIHDTCGVHYTFGLPGLLGGIAYIVLMMQETSWIMTSVFHQMLISSGTLGLYMAMGLASGLLTGLLLNVRIWRASHVAKYFDDQAFWEFPHLAVGF
ncbi:hypothetical protein HJG60_011012 [Phyllostomus discolor]|uniref:Blood group Rh(CE) polypeptide n=1 Tax=Phyllostomus discolor TaxID=89673 RepID=A0A6J2LTB0_9CHIR|nr:blood group Rh(CE) polypeptide [Phyllostomus discolor]KAF6109816.1 hypothetical protein HJG60_011012 [Phyllostomus discolor]